MEAQNVPLRERLLVHDILAQAGTVFLYTVSPQSFKDASRKHERLATHELRGWLNAKELGHDSLPCGCARMGQHLGSPWSVYPDRFAVAHKTLRGDGLVKQGVRIRDEDEVGICVSVAIHFAHLLPEITPWMLALFDYGVTESRAKFVDTGDAVTVVGNVVIARFDVDVGCRHSGIGNSYWRSSKSSFADEINAQIAA